MNFIVNNLAIGNYQEALEPSHDISALLCVAREKEIYGSHCLYYKVPIADMQSIPPEQLQEAVEWIRGHIGGHKIMVFCNAGVGRSPSVVIAYLCCVLGYSFGNAVECVAVKRPCMSVLPDLLTGIEAVKKRIA